MGKKEPQAFKPYVIKCDNVSKELKTAAKSHKLNVSQLDFDILSFTTYIKSDEYQGDEEWVEVDKDILKKLKDKDFLIQEDLEIRQVYEVRIKPLEEESKDELDLLITGNKAFTRVSIVIKGTSVLDYSQELFSGLVELFNKKKLRLGLLVGIFDDCMRNDLKDLVLKLKEEMSLKDDFKVRLCECIDPIPSIDDNLIFHYKNKGHKEDEKGRVDHSQRDFLFPVTENELLIEYVKPKEGKAGRNCKGQYVGVEEPTDDHAKDLKFSIDQKTIKRSEDKNAIIYLAMKNGYIDFKNNTFEVAENLDVDEISFKKTGSISAGKETNVKINVKENDSMKDAIGSGVKVDVAEANIEGSVGDGAEIRGGSVKIGGQTHKSSIIDVEQAEINVHKGYVKAKDVKISRLENGKVEAEVVRISEVIGGEVRAKEIYVDTVKSHAFLNASKLISINAITGDDNRFIVDPLALSESADLITNIKQAIENLHKDIEAQEKQFKKFKEELVILSRTAQLLTGRIMQAKEEGRKPEIGDMIRLKEFKAKNSEIKTLQDAITNKKAKLKKFEKDLAKLQEAIFDARIVNTGTWSGFNTIKFRLVNPDREIEYSPRGFEREIFLVEDGDDFKIESEG